MITQALVDFGTGVAAWIASLVPAVAIPGWFTDFGATVNGFFGTFDGLGVWAPWVLLGSCVALSIGVWVVCAVVKLLRAVASYVPFFGGAG